jgi:hypothetical protein
LKVYFTKVHKNYDGKWDQDRQYSYLKTVDHMFKSGLNSKKKKKKKKRNSGLAATKFDERAPYQNQL